MRARIWVFLCLGVASGFARFVCQSPCHVAESALGFILGPPPRSPTSLPTMQAARHSTSTWTVTQACVCLRLCLGEAAFVLLWPCVSHLVMQKCPHFRPGTSITLTQWESVDSHPFSENVAGSWLDLQVEVQWRKHVSVCLPSSLDLHLEVK